MTDRFGTPERPRDAKAPWWLRDRIVLGAALAISLALVLPVLYAGWVPFDEGWIVEQAMRVRAGELPHRDFDDLWTGGWSIIHGGLFAVLGPSMRVFRTVILIGWTAGLAALYVVVRRYIDPVLAAVGVVTAALWTLWAWQLPLLNWFYFPCALLVVLCVRQFTATTRLRWLVCAGALVGVLSTLKIIGFYLLAALLFWVVRAAADVARAGRHAAPGKLPRWAADARWFVLLPTGVLIALSLWLTQRMPGAESAVVLIAGPSILFGIAFAARLWKRGPLPWAQFLRALARLGGIVLLGFAVPVVVFLVPYVVSHSLDALWHGVFVAPMGRFASTAAAPPWWRVAVKLSGPALLLWLAVRRAREARGWAGLLAVLVLGVAYGATYGVLDAVRPYLFTLLSVLPLWVMAAWAAADHGDADAEPVLLAGIAATALFLQLPFASLNYLLASAPLWIATSLASPLRLARRQAALFVLVALATAALLGARQLRPINDEIQLTGNARLPNGEAIRIPRRDSIRYAELIDFVTVRLDGGGLYVFPWHNELYYFTGTRNPTRHSFAALTDSLELAPARLLPQLAHADTRVVVLFPPGRGEWPAAWRPLIRALQSSWPCREVLDGWAEVHWSPRPVSAARDTGECQVQAAASAPALPPVRP